MTNIETTDIETQKIRELIDSTKSFDVEMNPQALVILEEATQRARFIKNKSLLAEGLLYSARRNRDVRNLDRAYQQIHESIQIFQDIGEEAKAVKAENVLAQLYENEGKYSEASEILMKCLAFWERLEDYDALTIVLNNIGNVSRHIGDFSKALSYFLRASEYANSEYQRAAILNNIGLVYNILENFETALHYYFQALKIYESMTGRFTEIANALTNIGCIFGAMKQYDEAMRYYVQSIPMREKAGDPYWHGNIYVNIAKLQKKNANFDEALENFEKAIGLFKQAQNDREVASTLNDIAEVYYALGKKDLAMEVCAKAFAVFNSTDSGTQDYKSYHNLGWLLLQKGEIIQAKKLLDTAFIIAQQSGIPSYISQIYDTYSQLYSATGEWEKAFYYQKEYFTEELRRLQEANNHKTNALLAEFSVERSREEAEFERKKSAELSATNYKLGQANERLNVLNSEKNEILGIVAHDLKNPLNTISMLAQILREKDTKSQQETDEFLKLILETSGSMFQLINDLLDINAIESGKISLSISEFICTDIVNASIKMQETQATSKGIKLHLEDTSDGIMIRSDFKLLKQVLDNLISNAVKYSFLNSDVYVRARLVNEKKIRFEIQDKGQGISGQDMQKLFKRFSKLTARPTAGEHSSGLGLSIAQKLIETLGGKLWCESEEGIGSTFFVELSAFSH